MFDRRLQRRIQGSGMSEIYTLHLYTKAQRSSVPRKENEPSVKWLPLIAEPESSFRISLQLR